MQATVEWYLNHLDWCDQVRKQSGYSGERIGEKVQSFGQSI
jgi:dTDP-glucose 4,6-dehydratase